MSSDNTLFSLFKYLSAYIVGSYIIFFIFGFMNSQYRQLERESVLESESLVDVPVRYAQSISSEFQDKRKAKDIYHSIPLYGRYLVRPAYLGYFHGYDF